ncbi:Tmk Thymidylate kinase [Burkholderiales bacterium]
MTAMRPMAGRFLVLEGVDGAGKSSHIPFIQDWLAQRGLRVRLTREPGGSPLAESLRTLMLHQPMDGLTEALAVFAARRDHLTQTVWPALAAGEWVLSDRYVDSSWAYQGGGRGVSASLLETLTRSVETLPTGQALEPDLVFYFDLDPEQAAVRRGGRQAHTGESPDRFEQEDIGFFSRVREGYRLAAARRPGRAVWLDASQTMDALEQQISEALERLMT